MDVGRWLDDVNFTALRAGGEARARGGREIMGCCGFKIQKKLKLREIKLDVG